MISEGIDLGSHATAVIAVVSRIAATARDLAFDCGIPIAGFYWYRLKRTNGRLLFLVGFSVYLVVEIVNFLLMSVRSISTAYFLAIYSARGLLGHLAIAVALAGFIIIVMKEEKQA